MTKAMKNLRYCPDCCARPGQIHMLHCDMEMCSVCGEQRLGCNCKDHDRAFARWLGQSPAEVFSAAMDISIDEYLEMDGDAIFCTKPRIQDAARVLPGTPDEKARLSDGLHDIGPVWPPSARALKLVPATKATKG